MAIALYGEGLMFLTVKQAANLLRLELYQVYYLLSMGEIEAVKIGRVWRVTSEGVCSYKEKRPVTRFNHAEA